MNEVGASGQGQQPGCIDQYCLLVLLCLFSPVLRSLRALQQASQLRKVQKLLGCPRTSLGSMSEATDVFAAAGRDHRPASDAGSSAAHRLRAGDPPGTGGKPMLRSYEMICLYLQGWAELDELMEHLAKLQPATA
jgi:hypothetical protein